jgi:hypothetical protein
VCSAAKDGTCKVWDVSPSAKGALTTPDVHSKGDSSSAVAPEERQALADVPCCVDGVAGAGSVATAKNVMQCRGCR